MPLSRVGPPKWSMYSTLSQNNAFFIPHNSQLTPSTEVILSILESGRGELLFAHHFNHVASSLYE
jgi:hypothetical protein